MGLFDERSTMSAPIWAKSGSDAALLRCGSVIRAFHDSAMRLAHSLSQRKIARAKTQTQSVIRA